MGIIIMKKSAVIAMLFASVSAIKMRDTPPGEEKDPDTKPTAEEKTAQAPEAAKAKAEGKPPSKPGPPAEKVETVDPIIAREHTTFYAQVFYDKAAGVWR